MNKKKFATIRAWNRKRNLLIKRFRYLTRLFITKLIWDKRNKVELDINSVKSILLLCNQGKLGDVIVDTLLIKNLSLADYAIDILVTNSNAVILQYNPYVRNIYIANSISLNDFEHSFKHNVPANVIEQLIENNYDLVVDPSLFNTPMHRASLLKKINPKNTLGFNKCRWLNHYGENIIFDNGNYNIHYPSVIDDEVKEYLNHMGAGNRNIILNLFAGAERRCLPLEQVQEIVNKIDSIFNKVNVILLDYEKKIDPFLFKNAKIYRPKSIFHTVSIISNSDLVISPDTSIVHIAAAFNKPLISIYQDIKDNKKLWGPGYSDATQILTNKQKIQDDDSLVSSIIESAKQHLSFLGDTFSTPR
ncbi:glycosyltransferase family 9 protein [Rickettsiella endosymbiont of Dermanyssus gallinae]|uniref:glycosyltransferase family 9 protein n=1 Tax=Rickettsiella endosymbiont of Dermanyssus gallinae TaxID=2856608 RepID=UPI001C531278|nr:glycosyltransferase family 9 protein [Rickettsiella endosymbiont of Dermanyssus gallinae]